MNFKPFIWIKLEFPSPNMPNDALCQGLVEIGPAILKDLVNLFSLLSPLEKGRDP